MTDVDVVTSAVDTIRARALGPTPGPVDRLRALDLDADGLVTLFIDRARSTVNLHPDRGDRLGRTVAEGLLADGASDTASSASGSMRLRRAQVGPRGVID